MNVRSIYLATGLIGALTLTSVAAGATPSAADFVQKASVANEFEIETSKVALEKSQNDDVKTFAQEMVDDHTKAAGKLKSVLQTSNSQLQPQDQLDDKHQKMLDKLNSASADDFDKQYIKIQTKAHKQAVSLFSDYSKSGDNQPLKQFAANTLPTLKTHLDHVKQLDSKQ